MTTNESKEMICKEFMDKYREWLSDYADLNDHDYGWKYGWQKNPNIQHKDNLKAVTYFQKYIFSGRWLPDWVKVGYDKSAIWELHNEGFLSYSYWSNWQARATGHTDFYYLSQKSAREIWKANKNAE